MSYIFLCYQIFLVSALQTSFLRLLHVQLTPCFQVVVDSVAYTSIYQLCDDVYFIWLMELRELRFIILSP